MIPYGRQDISEDDIQEVERILRSDFLTMGPAVPKFEQAICEKVVAQYAVAVNSATSALHIACLALGVGPGDWVWTSPNTFVASANCALYCGAKVDFVDIDSKTYNLCPLALETKLQQTEMDNRLPKVVIPVHFAGQPCDIYSIHRLSQRYGFKVIEDASHAIGASYNYNISEPEPCHTKPEYDTSTSGREKKPTSTVYTGSCCHCDITVFSFHPVKIITSGEGGMAITNNPLLSDKMIRFRSHGITSRKEIMHPRPDDEIWNYQQIDLGYNYRMTDIQAALGLSQLSRLDAFIRRRREIASIYDKVLSNFPVITPWQHPNMHSSYHLYPIRTNVQLCGKSQQELYKSLHKAGIIVNLHYIPVHRQPYYQSMGFRMGDYPEAENYHREAISIPIYPALSGEQQAYVIEILKSQLTQ